MQRRAAEDAFQTRGIETPLISAILYLVLFTLLSLVIFTRLRTKTKLRYDGVFALLAMAPATFFFVATLITNDDFRWNRHMSDIPSTTLDHGFTMVLIAEVMFVLACTLAKLSIMILVRRAMSLASAFWRGIVICTAGIVVAQGFTSLLLVVFQCGTPAKFLTVNQIACAAHSATILTSSILNILTDIAVLLIAIPCILSYQLLTRQKIVFAVIYTLGFMSTVAGISRAYFLYQASKQDDFTWAYYGVWISSSIQLYFGMISTTLPSTLLFFTRYTPQFFGPLTSLDQDFSSPAYPIHSPIHRTTSFFNNNGNISGDEELLDFEKSSCKSGEFGIGGLGSGGGFVTIETRPGMGRTMNLSEEDKEFIKITQHTVVVVSRAD